MGLCLIYRTGLRVEHGEVQEPHGFYPVSYHGYAFLPTYMRQMPKVIGVSSTTAKPADFIISVNLSGAGKRRADAGRYSYAPRFPEMRPPIAGRIFRKYSL